MSKYLCQNRHIFPTMTLLVAMLVGVFVACQTETVCEDATASMLRMRFYTQNEAGESTPISIDSLTIYGIEKSQEKIYNNRKSVAMAELPLNPGANQSGFVLVFPGEVHDTLLINYDRELNLISVECGFSMFYEIRELTNSFHALSAAEIINTLISNTFDEHLQIFLPDTDPDQ